MLMSITIRFWAYHLVSKGSKLTEKEISKAYRAKALELHPDKRPDDPNAHANFQSLKSSYEILKDEKARKLFDDLLRVRRERERHHLECDAKRQKSHLERNAKRQKMVSDLEARERAAFTPYAAPRDEEETIARKLKQEIARIRALHANKGAATASVPKRKTGGVGKESVGGSNPGLDKETEIKVSWEKVGEDYTAERLRDLFSKFGQVEDVVIKGSKTRGLALAVMATKDAAVASTQALSRDISSPLLVLHLQPVSMTDAPPVQKPEIEPNRLHNLVGAGHQSFEDDVLQKLQKAAQKQKLHSER